MFYRKCCRHEDKSSGYRYSTYRGPTTLKNRHSLEICFLCLLIFQYFTAPFEFIKSTTRQFVDVIDSQVNLFNLSVTDFVLEPVALGLFGLDNVALVFHVYTHHGLN